MSAHELFEKLQTLMTVPSAWLSSIALEEWYQRVYCPSGSVERREFAAKQVAGMAHSTFITDEIGGCLGALMDMLHELPARKAAFVRRLHLSYKQARMLDPKFVEEKTSIKTRAEAIWRRARAESNFALFAPHLAKVIAITREEAYLRGADRNDSNTIYPTLFELYEPGMDIATVERLLNEASDFTRNLLERVKARGVVRRTDFLEWEYDPDGLKALCVDAAKVVGFDFERGGFDLTTHPFCTRLGLDDVRITGRVSQGLPGAFFGVIHEAGHANYDHNLPGFMVRMWPEAMRYSLGIHESQSRGMENGNCRSRAFWEFYYPKLQARFPRLQEIPLEVFVAGINTARPTLIRVESDEATYNVHIRARFLVERGFMAGDIAVSDIPETFNQAIFDGLGIRPPNDTQGCMQDIHWSGGMIGYFPTYSLGNFFSAATTEEYRSDDPDWEKHLRRGDFTPYNDWMKVHIHQTGMNDTLQELVQRITGKPLSIDAWKRHIMSRVGPVYGIN